MSNIKSKAERTTGYNLDSVASWSSALVRAAGRAASAAQALRREGNTAEANRYAARAQEISDEIARGVAAATSGITDHDINTDDRIGRLTTIMLGHEITAAAHARAAQVW